MSEPLHFLRPLWFIAVPAFWLLVWWYRRSTLSGGAWHNIIDNALRPFVLNTGSTRGRAYGGFLIGLAGTLTVVALAGPTWEREAVPVFRSESALVVALDLSSSMNAEDVQPSRLTLAQFKVADLLDLRQDGQTALVVFAAQSFVVTPLTDDISTLLGQLRGLDTSIMPSQGSEPAAALSLAADLLTQAGVVGGHVLLVTDGPDAAAIERAEALLATRNFSLSVLGVGTTAGAPIPDAAGGFAKKPGGEIIMSALSEAPLRRLAELGGGIYLSLSADDSEVRRLENFVQASLEDRAQKLDDLAASQWREFGPWLLLVVLPLAAIVFRRGVLVAVLLASGLLPAPTVEAGWWRTPDQAAAKAWEDGDYAGAAREFTRPAWRGAATYRDGQFDAAVESFATGEDPESHYNRGNALARLGRYEEAISAYDHALEQDPAHADAQHNKTLLEKILSEQQPPPQDQGQQDKQQQGEKEQSPDQQQDGEGEEGGEQSGEEADQELSGGNSRGGSEQDDEQSQESGSKSGQEQAKQEGQEREPNSAEEAANSDNEPEQQVERESEAERAQATEQWLRQIPDDPSGLLRRKFQYQYKQRYGNTPYEGNRW